MGIGNAFARSPRPAGFDPFGGLLRQAGPVLEREPPDAADLLIRTLLWLWDGYQVGLQFYAEPEPARVWVHDAGPWGPRRSGLSDPEVPPRPTMLR